MDDSDSDSGAGAGADSGAGTGGGTDTGTGTGTGPDSGTGTGTGTGRARDESDRAHAELIAVARDWAAAIVANDAERIAAFVSDGWVMVSDAGVSPGTDFLSMVASGDLTHSAMDQVGPARIRIHGDTALYTARVTNTAHYRGERFDADEWTTDVFVRRSGRWECVLTHITPAAPATPERGV